MEIELLLVSKIIWLLFGGRIYELAREVSVEEERYFGSFWRSLFCFSGFRAC